MTDFSLLLLLRSVIFDSKRKSNYRFKLPRRKNYVKYHWNLQFNRNWKRARLSGFLYFHVIISRGTLILDLFFTSPSHARACVITMISSKLHLRLRTRKKNTEYVFWQENKNAQGWVRNQNKNEREYEE